MHARNPKGYRSNRRETSYIESGFVCSYCGRALTPDPVGSGHRNHCPWCLRSLHVDDLTGDRESHCRGIMEPVAISVRQGKEWAIIHRCTECGVLKENRTAGDDNALALFSLAVRPVARPPFPLDRLMDNSK
jgi:hypothetical protein